MLEATSLVATLKLHGTALVDGKTAVIPSCFVCLDLVEWAHRNIASSRTSIVGSTALSGYGPTFGGGHDMVLQGQLPGHSELGTHLQPEWLHDF